MKKTITKIVTVFAAFALAFTGLPTIAGSIDVHAATAKAPAQVKNLKASNVTQTSVKLAWKKIAKNKNTKGYAIYRNGKLIKRVSYKTNIFNDTKLKAGTKYKYAIKAYNTHKQKQFYNSKTKKWQTKKPAKNAWKGKKVRQVTKYKYGKASAVKQVTTKKKSTSVSTANKAETYFKPDTTYLSPDGTDYGILADKYKWMTVDGSGNVSINVPFDTDGGKDWIEKNYQIVVQDVTPKIYKKALGDLGCSSSLSANTSVSNGRMNVSIKSGPAVVVIKMHDKNGHAFGTSSDGRKIKTVYYVSPRNESYDKSLYVRARKKVENALWTNDMTVEQKLDAVATYIGTTTHYPGYADKRGNKTYWDNWSVEGKFHLVNELELTSLENYLMVLQGGKRTCYAANNLYDFAKDLGLKELGYYYDAEYRWTNKLGEGFYIGVGQASMNWSSPSHTTFYYTNANGETMARDVNGIMYDTDCSQHDYRCINNIISLK